MLFIALHHPRPAKKAGSDQTDKKGIVQKESPSENTTPPKNDENVQPASGREWTVDAAGGAGSSGSDLAAVVAKAADGDVIHIRPGTYAGGFTIKHALHLIGDSSGGDLATIQSSGKDCINVTAQNVIVENVALAVSTPDQSRTFRVTGGGSAQLKQVTINTQSKFGATATDNASITADACVFSTAGQGSAFQPKATRRRR